MQAQDYNEKQLDQQKDWEETPNVPMLGEVVEEDEYDGLENE